MKHKWHGLAIAVPLSVAVFMQVAPVHAGKQIYPAAMCVRWSGNNVVPSLSSSRIFNNSTTDTMNVDCPILHQNFDYYTGNSLDDADIGLIDDSVNNDIRCWLTSRYQVGSTLYGGTGGTRNTSYWGTYEQNRDFDPTPTSSENWYYIGCSVPPKESGRSSSGITYYSAQD
jgi:hypothetical protein